MTVPSRLRWRCRRGTRELDLILSGFLERRYEALSDADRSAFEQLLECEDDRLQSWLLTPDRPDHEPLRRIVELIRQGL